MTPIKIDASRQLETMGKREPSDDGREMGLSAVPLNVELLV
jgi:hypothetical protein